MKYKPEFRTLHVEPKVNKRFCNSQNHLCKLNYEFHWNKNETCLATFKCDELDKSICNGYGITIQHYRRVSELLISQKILILT